jgi:hypothetical protein
MNERDMEEEGKDREEEGWGIGIKKGIFLELFGIVTLCLLMCMCYITKFTKKLLFLKVLNLTPYVI